MKMIRVKINSRIYNLIKKEIQQPLIGNWLYEKHIYQKGSEILVVHRDRSISIVNDKDIILDLFENLILWAGVHSNSTINNILKNTIYELLESVKQKFIAHNRKEKIKSLNLDDI